jgi:hypothetical protein
MDKVITVGLDIAKQVFHVHGADGSGRAVFSRKITRAKLPGSSPLSLDAWWRWRHAVVLTTGRERSCGWVMMFG